jgi:hypothetical protein
MEKETEMYCTKCSQPVMQEHGDYQCGCYLIPDYLLEMGHRFPKYWVARLDETNEVPNGTN